jgi:hypothetical protein
MKIVEKVESVCIVLKQTDSIKTQEFHSIKPRTIKDFLT